MSVQTLSAAQAVGEMLQSPEDLIKIISLRKKLEKEKASIDVKLKSGVKDQLDGTREALRKLHMTKDNLRAIQDEMIAIDKMCRDPKNVVKSFDRISSVSAVHRNFAQTEEMVNNLTDMHDKIDLLEDWLQAERRDIPGPATNLLMIHYHITQLEAFRNTALHQAQRSTEASRQTLGRWFEKLNQLIADFEAYLRTLAQNILPIVRAGYPDVVVKLIKICEIEEREDEKAAAITIIKKTAKMDAVAKFKSVSSREIKRYRAITCQNIRDSIKDTFESAYLKFKDDPSEFFENSNWMYQDIIRIQDEVVLCFPSSYEIYNLYMSEYHKSLDRIIRRCTVDEPNAKTLLTLSSWLKEHKANMKDLEVPPELLEPPLLDGNEKTLMQDYLKLIIRKMDEWADNLMKSETEEFTQRKEPPEIDSDGMYGMQGATILFELFNQQADAAAESGQAVLLRDISKETGRIMRSTQDQWSKTIDSELKKQFDKPEETPGGLVEYIIALANDQIKCADYTEKLSERLEESVSDKYKKDIVDSLNDGLEGYLDVATKKCVTTLIDLIFHDLKPVVKQLFTASWYDGIMSQIVETMLDYMRDYQEHLNPLILGVLVEELVDTFMILYLTGLGNASKLKMPATTDRIKEDVREAFQFFATLKPAKELEEQFDVVDLVLSMLEASKSMAFLSFWDFAKVHGPNLAFVEAIMRARDDFDRSAANEVMESVKRKVKDEDIVDPPEPTIMKRIQLQSTFQRLFGAATGS